VKQRPAFLHHLSKPFQSGDVYFYFFLTSELILSMFVFFVPLFVLCGYSSVHGKYVIKTWENIFKGYLINGCMFSRKVKGKVIPVFL
jgi:hypothetical protein